MSVETSGMDEVQRRLAGVSARLRDLTPVMAVAAADTMTLIDDSFAESRGADGSAFAPLKSRDGTPLVDTGRLRSSMFARGERAGLVFGTNVRYARPHVTGTSRIPKRNPIPAELVGSQWSIIDRGPAATHWERVRASVLHYIVTGEVR